MLIDKWQLRLIQLISVAGILLAFYLFLYHEGNLVAVCGASGWDDCGAVSGPDAPYSSIGSIPVALIGLIGYIAIFLAIWLEDWIPVLSDYLPEIMVGMNALAFVFTLWLTGLELFVIHALCRYCVVSAVFVLTTFILSISYLRAVNATD
ncbi:MAG: vitamin K epoxide reductase family protein [Anaerolineales bacterium]|nr:vitamin K epoxide reductase family protein [Anaerolineales bacterium]